MVSPRESSELDELTVFGCPASNLRERGSSEKEKENTRRGFEKDHGSLVPREVLCEKLRYEDFA